MARCIYVGIIGDAISGGDDMQEQNEYTLTEKQKELICRYYSSEQLLIANLKRPPKIEDEFEKEFQGLIPDYKERLEPCGLRSLDLEKAKERLIKMFDGIKD